MLVFNLPNVLTIIRFLLIPVFAVFLTQDVRAVAAFIYCTACATDILDGYLARKNNQITQFGRYMDPLADKLIQLTAVFILGIKRDIPMFIPYIALAKEGLMIIGGYVLYKKLNFKIVSNWFGKLTTILFFVAILLGIFRSDYAKWAAVLAIVSSIYALARYFVNYVEMIGKAEK